MAVLLPALLPLLFLPDVADEVVEGESGVSRSLLVTMVVLLAPCARLCVLLTTVSDVFSRLIGSGFEEDCAGLTSFSGSPTIGFKGKGKGAGSKS